MDQARHHFFTCTAFTKHQDGNVHVGNQCCLRPQLAHVGTGGHKESLIAEVLNFTGIILLVRAQALINNGIQFGFLEWLSDIVRSSQPDRLHYFLRIVHARKHHHAHVRLQLAQTLERFESVNPRHYKIQQHEIRLQAFLHQIQRLFTSGRSLHGMIIHLEKRLYVAQHSRLIVH